MTIYQASLAELPQDRDIFQQGMQIGDFYFICTFKWAVANQEQYDIIQSHIVDLAKNDPLISKEDGAYNRNYDWIEFYLYFRRLSDAQIGDWLDSTDIVPAATLNKERWLQIQTMYEKASLANELDNLLLQYSEVMRWEVTVTDTEGNTTTGFVEPGGWYRNQSLDYSFRFTSDRTVIGHNDLPYVNMEVRFNAD